MGDPAGRAGRSEKHLWCRPSLESERKNVLETTLRRVLREELKALPSQPAVQQEKAIPEQMMGFLGSLMGEE